MSHERRKHLRVEWVSPGTIYVGDGSPGRPCLVSNLSNGRAKISRVDAHLLPDEFMLSLSPRRGPSRKCRVMWRTKHDVGVEFAEPFPTAGDPPKTRSRRVPANA
jgi:hypothetical protein